MRDIKFKYYFTLDDKVINTKIFIMDDIEDINFNTILFLNIDINKYNVEKMKLYRSQFTGLKDKNGIEIYEGDICRCWGGCEFNGYHEYNKIYEVKWQGSGFEMMINDCVYGWNYSNGFEYIKVIGNIYENPELLKEGI